MATLIENEGLVALYKGENDSILLEINGKELTLQQPFKFNYGGGGDWNPVAADIFNDPRSDNDNNILLLWNNLD